MLRRLLFFFAFAAPAAMAQTPCTGGSAGAYACDGVDLLAHLAPSTFSSPGSAAPSAMNDIWGWTHAASGREFALVGMTNGTAFVEVTNPTSPVYLGKLPTASSASSWRDIKVYADHAFIVSEAGSHGMQVFDLSRLLSVFAPPITFGHDALYTGLGRAHNIVIDETAGLAFGVGVRTGAQCTGGGLHMVDISTPTSPTFAGCYDGDGYTHDAQCVTYDGPDTDYTGHQICVASNEDTITIVDVSTPASPALIAKGFYPSPSYTHQGWFTDDQRYFVVDDELDGSNSTPTRSIVFDLSDLDAPNYEFAFSGSTNATDHNQYVRGDYVFQSNYAAGLRILDASGIASGSMTEIGYFDTYPANNNHGFNGQWSNYPYFASGTLVANDINTGFFVLAPDVLAGGPGGTGPIVLTSPTGGESFQAGTTQTITWDPGGVPPSTTLSLNLRRTGGDNERLATSIPNSGSFSWDVSPFAEPSGEYRLFLVYNDPDTDDRVKEKSGFFEIFGGTAPPDPIAITSPTAGTVWTPGTTVTITWDPGDVDPGTDVTIKLKPPSGTVRITAGTPNTGSFEWEVPGDLAPGTGYRVVFTYTDGQGDVQKPKSEFFEVGAPGALAAKTSGPLTLGSAVPNPARGRTVVPFELSDATDVRLSVHDARGREVAVLAEGYRQTGTHEAAWETGALSPGVYVVRLAAGASVTTQRVVVVR